MGLFSFLTIPEKKTGANIDLAEELLYAPALSTGEVHDKKLIKILQKCPTRQAVLDKVIELCGPPETPRQKYISAIAYIRSKSEHRDNAIRAIELYLAGEPYEGAFKNSIHTWGSKQFTPEEELKIHLAQMYANLGKAYEGKYAYNQALPCYSKEIELTPFYPGPYCRSSSIHIKKNQLTAAMNVLQHAKKTRYYKPITYKTIDGDTVTEDTFKKVIDNHILALEKKIEKGYVYTIKKKK